MSNKESSANTWINVLYKYNYPYDLKHYMNASNHNSWFSLSSKTGNRDDTIKFEDHFRDHAKDAIAPWLEVVFWKMFSTGIDAANDRSKKKKDFLEFKVLTLSNYGILATILQKYLPKKI